MNLDVSVVFDGSLLYIEGTKFDRDLVLQVQTFVNAEGQNNILAYQLLQMSSKLFDLEKYNSEAIDNFRVGAKKCTRKTFYK